MDKPNTPETYADLLKARGDVPISVLRSMREQLDNLLSAIDTMDKVFEVPPAPTKAETAIAAAIRAKYPVLPADDGAERDSSSMSDAEVLAYFGVQVGK